MKRESFSRFYFTFFPLLLLFLFCRLAVPTVWAEPLREERPFNDGWTFAQVISGQERAFSVTNAESPKALKPGTPVTLEPLGPSASVRLPHDWGIEGEFDRDPKTWGGQGKLPWRGVGWYTKKFSLSEEEACGRAVLDFGGCMAFPEVYVNGVYAGGWDYGYQSFQVDLTPFIFAGENSVSVRCDTKAHYSRWYPGAGIYRPVKLILTSREAWLPEGSVTVTTPEVVLDVPKAGEESENAAGQKSSAPNARLTPPSALSAAVQVEIRPEFVRELTASPSKRLFFSQGMKRPEISAETIRLELYGPDGTLVKPESLQITERAEPVPEQGKGERPEPAPAFRVSMKLANPKLWDVTEANLYRLRVILPTDELTVTFGIRTFEWTADDGFHLNGRRVQLYGVNLHHDQGILGAAAHPAAIERQLKIMKDMGVNAVRTSHNPSSREFLDLCDQLGLVVWNELFDKWNTTADLLEQEYFDAFTARQIQRFTERDRNHPCVFVWSIGNEIADIERNGPGTSNPNLDAERRVAHTVKCFRQFDPTRPVGFGCFVSGTCGPENHVRDSLDVTGWNYGGKYREARVRYPQMPLLYTESASAVSTRGYYELPHPSAKDTYNRETFQVDGYDFVSANGPRDIPDVDFQRMEIDSYVAGEFVWTGFDYLGEPTPFDREARSSYFGIVDLSGLPKDRYFLYRSYWAPEKTTVHVLPHWNWEGKQSKVPVYVYTNGDSAELFLNGKSLGRKTKIQSWDETALKDPAREKGVTYSSSSEETRDGRRNLTGCAFDADSATRWCASDMTVPQWLQVDFGKSVSNRFQTIQLEKDALNYRFRAECSLDGTNWETYFRLDFPKGLGRTVRIPAPEKEQKARFFRLYFEETRGQSWASVCEWSFAEPGPCGDLAPYYEPMAKYRLRWENVPYEPGVLEAAAYRDGKEIGRQTVRTAGDADAIRLTPETKQFRSRDDLIYVLIEAVDARGTLCPWDSRTISASVTGPAELVGIDAGNPMCFETISDAEHPLFYGKAVLVLRSCPGDGEVQLKVKADGLKEAELTIPQE